MTKLSEKFNKEIRPSLQKELGYKSIEATPKLEKVVVSAGVGEINEDKKKLLEVEKVLAKITGQKPKRNVSVKAVSAFKLRIGQVVGYTVTLRDQKMYDFISRLANAAIPRIRDFKGLSNGGFDRQGNYCLGVREHTIIPEIKHEETLFPFGFQVNIKTTAENDEEAKLLLEKLGFPFCKEGKQRY